CYELAFVEIKPPKEDHSAKHYLEDYWKLANLCKDSLDAHPAYISKMAAIQVFGYQMSLYFMTFENGINHWKHISTSYLPRDHQDRGCVHSCLELLKTLHVFLGEIDVSPFLQTPPRDDEGSSSLPNLSLHPSSNITPSSRR
ncbi:hypothetical protein BGZ65_011299, partial [Modicella reniformis]